MVIEAALPVLRVILAGVQQGGAYELDVVQRRPAAGCLDLVIPVHHHALFAGVHTVVIDVLFYINYLALLLALKFRIFLFQQVVVHQIDDEQIPALLDIRNARLPKQVQQVDVPDLNVTQPVVLLAVPEHTVSSRAVLQLLPPVVGIHLLEMVVLLHHGKDLAQHLCALLVALLTRQHNRLRVVVHRVCVLVLDGVEQPCRSGLGLRRCRLDLLAASVHPLGLALADALPVPQLPPQLIVDDAAFQIALSVLVLCQ